jgi:hypothetical protein
MLRVRVLICEGKKVITFFAGCPRLKTAGSVVIASNSGGGAGATGAVAATEQQRGTNRVQICCPSSFTPKEEKEGEREREGEYHSGTMKARWRTTVPWILGARPRKLQTSASRSQ